MDRVESLVQYGLARGKFFGVNTSEMRARYNQCLEYMGIAKTKLSRFNIDLRGWSPEIAREKGDIHYLSHGAANVVGIILSIDQQDASLFLPYYSFDKFLFIKIYQDLESVIMDVTTQTGICVDVENGISNYSYTDDLLMVNNFDVKFETPVNITEKSIKQKELVIDFENSSTAWADEEFRQKIIDSAIEFGDMRYRKLNLKPVYFNEASSFYTGAFGGVFVFREYSKKHKKLIIPLKEEVAMETSNEYGMWINNPELVQELFSRGIIELDLDYYANNPDVLMNIKDDILANYLCSHYPIGLNYAKMTNMVKKRHISKHQDTIPPEFFEIERVQSCLRIGKVPNISRDLGIKLARPKSNTSPLFREVVWMLLSEIDPANIRRLYRYNKNKFFMDFSDWTKSKKSWVEHILLNKI